MGTYCSSKRQSKASETGPVVTAKATDFRFNLLRYFTQLLTVLFLALGANFAFAIDPSHVSFTLEGCKNDGTITLPIGGKFVCPDAAYTTGNLGKGWNELDLVPHRLTVDARNAAPSTQTYTISVVADNLNGGALGYDVISDPVLNTALSSASCKAATLGSQATLTPGLGGLDASIYRLVTITQAKNTVCVYDYHERLALGSHLFNGSSLHSDLANSSVNCSGIGCKDVSIPVKEIKAQELSKDMSAAQDSAHSWSLNKSANPESVSFGDVCRPDAPVTQPVTLTVTWTRVDAAPGEIAVVTQVYATNPAARIITVNVSDQIYQSTTQTTPLGAPFSGVGPIDVPANTSNFLVLTHSLTLPASANIDGSLNDVATATYKDLVTGVPVPGQTTATASTTIAVNETNATATITDSESITGSGLKFSVVATPAVGSFTGGYAAGTQTVGPVGWTSAAQSGSGSVTFNKTIYLNPLQVTSGVLTDTATLLGSDGFSPPPATVNVGISSSASAKLTIQKTIPAFLAAGEKIEVQFHISGTSATNYSADKVLTFTGGGLTTQTVDLTGLAPDNYTVVEGTATFFPASGPSQEIAFSDTTGPTRIVPLTVSPEGIPTCEGTASYNNELQAGPATAQVQKITDPVLPTNDPDINWVFTIQGPPAWTGNGITATAGANAGYVDFVTPDLIEGPYTVTETLITHVGWDLTNVVPSSDNTVCSFTVDYPENAGQQFQCSFTNTKRGKAEVVKKLSGETLSGTQTFTFQLRQGASLAAAGETKETQDATAANGGTFTFSTLLVPGTHYQLCEEVLPGWLTSLSSAFTVFNPDGDNSVLCTDFTVAAGETKSFAIDNTPPPGGQARTIGFWKNWTASSCKQSNGKQDPVLDQTLALATPPGVQVGTLYLTGSSTHVCEAVSILNKSDVVTGKKLASNPLYGLAAQLLGAELNYLAGAATCPAITTAIADANALLVKYGFNGTGTYPSLIKADATLARSLAAKLDAYNNNLPSACL